MKTRTNVLLIAAIGLLMLAPVSQGAYYLTAADIDAGHAFAQEFPQVGFITMVREGGLFGGSATLISDRWLLTAGHNLTNGGDPSQILEFRFRTGVDPFGPSGPDHFRLADEWYVHPDYVEGVGLGVDLALVRLSEPILDILPMPLSLEPSFVGMEFSGAGYGQPGSVETGMLPFDWKKRAGRNTIVWWGTSEYIHFVLDEGVSALPLEWALTGGDSGGPVVRNDNTVFGVNSFGSGGFLSGAQPIYSHLDWIHGVTGLPEPGTAALLLVGGAFALRRRRSFP